MKTDRELLKEANEIIRSFNAVVERKGQHTNWDGLGKEAKRVLIEHHELGLYETKPVSYALVEPTCSTCKKCDIDDNRINTKYFCKITEEDIEDIDQHYCDDYKKR